MCISIYERKVKCMENSFSCGDGALWVMFFSFPSSVKDNIYFISTHLTKSNQSVMNFCQFTLVFLGVKFYVYSREMLIFLAPILGYLHTFYKLNINRL